jgi:hypothetical protein
MTWAGMRVVEWAKEFENDTQVGRGEERERERERERETGEAVPLWGPNVPTEKLDNPIVLHYYSTATLHNTT